MTGRAARAVALAALLAALLAPARAFYLPGVAPQDFARVRAADEPLCQKNVPLAERLNGTRGRRISPDPLPALPVPRRMIS